MDNNLFPVLVYEYDKQGRYRTPLRCDEPQLKAWMLLNLRRVLDEKVELRITDMLDLLAFHCLDGKIIYDGERHYPDGKNI